MFGDMPLKEMIRNRDAQIKLLRMTLSNLETQVHDLLEENLALSAQIAEAESASEADVVERLAVQAYEDEQTMRDESRDY